MHKEEKCTRHYIVKKYTKEEKNLEETEGKYLKEKLFNIKKNVKKYQ